MVKNIVNKFILLDYDLYYITHYNKLYIYGNSYKRIEEENDDYIKVSFEWINELEPKKLDITKNCFYKRIEDYIINFDIKTDYIIKPKYLEDNDIERSLEIWYCYKDIYSYNIVHGI